MTALPLDTLSARRSDGTDTSLAEFRGQVLLVVNTASACGFTPQYAGLEALQRDYGPRGFNVLAFPCNQFGRQEPGDDASIAAFCETRFQTSFPLFAKIDVNGPQAHPLFQALKAAQPGLLGSEGIKWNFTKFLIDRQGEVVGRYAPTTTPEKLRGDIEKLL
ncbi:glutathione peroxidase [Pseudoroseomonas cervicalis]|uniref:glutathione peroxidase n=1 Tax=Teichococcus cervicalis TaxID=204525 RepID=UPI0022F17475|nr:glutathione peroxidase [Pseudoroseomonas cervicalis]WBV43829.1 glutathione peroxidase [Pseudoroseomonas cervicalis]